MPLLSAFFVLLSCITFSASAAAVSYHDFDPEIVVDGDNNLIIIDIPVDYYRLGLRDGNLNTLGSWRGVDSFSYYTTSGQEYSILFTIFQNGAPFSLTDIPDGTLFYVDFSVSTYTTLFERDGAFQSEYWWYDASGATVSWEYHNETPKVYNGLNGFEFAVSKKDGVSSFSFGGTYYSAPCIASGELRFSLESVRMQFSISSFYLLQQSNQQTHAMLDEVNRQLADQGKTMQDILNQQSQTNNKLDSIQSSQIQTNNKLDSIQSSQQQTNNKLDSIQSDQQQTNNKLDSIQGEQEQTNDKLDDIINGEVDPEAPEGADRIDDLDQAEGQLREEAQAGLDQGVEIQQNVLQILEEFANGFAVFSWIFGLFAKQPFISGLLYVSVALGSVSALLNLGLSAQAANNRANIRAQRQKKGG